MSDRPGEREAVEAALKGIADFKDLPLHVVEVYRDEALASVVAAYPVIAAAVLAEAEEERKMLIKLYSAALDEVYRLRRAAAYEADATEAHLSLKSFPKTRRPFAEEQIERGRAAARGEARLTYAPIGDTSLRHAMREAGASATLTRSQFEDEIRRSRLIPGFGEELQHD